MNEKHSTQYLVYGKYSINVIIQYFRGLSVLLFTVLKIKTLLKKEKNSDKNIIINNIEKDNKASVMAINFYYPE